MIDGAVIYFRIYDDKDAFNVVRQTIKKEFI